AVAGAFPGDVVVHAFWGAYDDRTYGTLLDAAVDAVGYDLVTAPERSAELVREFGTHDDVALGVVDGQNTLVESPGT
ncbi:MAG: 5-methyltetrahydropteroyltriglutamate--homocysteine methyltransferase, partial [Actinobacteria bacterium]|nr:5-methyltetrahydropteroyltriglutamate--homocysteine methyltransferase [Actinomycetota bacterium]NIU71317.1 5-methyltetrahydropteroyltriglutamate--homocysteine methyltransferase [Actinomycetota bacterium]NIW33271.1 5-methyltetrahydropteroyltriglutamate--homocysteine methyltransferase [Actinomycetota bacterium]NIX19453.1 5-methyltetrahydropteroyltriglutamate--homocysteine methyltransferase [Actinomycetota bacterium]